MNINIRVFIMKNILKPAFALLMTCAVVLAACSGNAGKKNNGETNEINNNMQNEKETVLLMKTSMGDVKIKLYNKTPKHRDNMVKLVEDGFYDGLLFHRVINEFMVQGGDPESKDAPKGKMLGAGDVGYTVPAEFVFPEYYHKKGALAAARQGDQVNPQKASSGCQFYIVTGKVYSEVDLLSMEEQMNNSKLNKAFNDIAMKRMDEIRKYQAEGNQEALYNMQEEIYAQAEQEAAKTPDFKFTPQQIKDYTTIGGTPFLDREYTVFGEVVEGMEVVEKIEKVKTSKGDRPQQDVKIIEMTVVE